ncbi:MAG: tetraacyldisaccharide 4'-kinase, partial [Chitinophagales bacterium]
MKKINVFRWLLFPFGWLYGVVGWCRNKLYDWKVLKATGFDGVRLIGVGNLSSGGTGKTPHVEYLVNRYKENYKVATLSRGYKRKTKGFVLATAQSTALEIGDEPMQMYRKFGKEGVSVAVCENRVEGVRKLLELQPDIEVIVLDDVFQHRRIQVDTLYLLTDFSHLFTEDFVLPMGSLREFRKGYERADVIVVTKCSNDLTEVRKEEIVEGIRPLEHQKVIFSFLEYGVPYSFFDAPHTVQHPPNPLQRGNSIVLDWEEDAAVLVVCGI